jgi:predicted  nucleic acid-binding Zn ribbon protein
LYEFPYTYDDGRCYNDINWWHRNYSQLDSLWFRGEINESYCNEMLSSISGPLTEQGLKICRKIGSLTGKDCYYYLFNHYNKLNGESCPSCGEPWKLSEVMFDEYDHRCDTCKIISKTGFEE